MANKNFESNPNPLVSFLKKPAKEFTKKDIMEFIRAHNIEMLNFRYVAADGRLKALNFIINNEEHLNQVLSTGERVDGSSLFPFIEAGSSDLYVVPRYSTAFVNPFEDIPTIDILCSYFNNEGKPLESAPEYVLRKAHNDFKKATGLTFKGLGELEYYIIDDKDENSEFPAVDQKGYHESGPFAKFEHIRIEAMHLVAQCGGVLKYGHSEVGNFTDDKYYYEQQELEFLPCDIEDAADQLVIAKWILRKLSHEYGVNISLAPKITVGKAGSGMHVHFMLEKDGVNMMVENGVLSDIAKKAIAGMLDVADALTAWGNTIPTSYLRLVPHQEAPTNICWGDRNRSVLVRVPLGWSGANNMINIANPQENGEPYSGQSKQTAELRSGDGSADIYPFLAAMVVAARHGLEMPNALELAEKLYVNVNIFHEENKERLEQLKGLPVSCYESALALEKKRVVFEKNGIFMPGMIDSTIAKLKSYDDDKLSERLFGKNDEIAILVAKYIHTM